MPRICCPLLVLTLTTLGPKKRLLLSCGLLGLRITLRKYDAEFVPVADRSGPTSEPRPFTSWHEAHPPLPQNVCSPATASPTTTSLAAALLALRLRRYVMMRQTLSVGSAAKAGIWVPGTPV